MKYEIWRDIENYEGYYQVSDQGNIRSVRKDRVMSSKDGKFLLCVNGNKKTVNIKQEVAKAFFNFNGSTRCIKLKDVTKPCSVDNIIIESNDSFEDEVWKDIKGYEGYYQVSNQGRVKSLSRTTYYNRIDTDKTYKREEQTHILKPSESWEGSYTVCLFKDNKEKYVKVHRIVAETFIDNPNKYRFIKHLDGNSYNNCVSNLEWSANYQKD